MDALAAGAGGGKPSNLGGSLPVPNVQDLAARLLRGGDLGDDILRRYLRDDDIIESSSSSSVVLNEDEDDVPVVDLGRLLLGPDQEEEAAKLRWACEDWGFFQVVNHGVPEEVMEDMKADLRRFFELPLKEKMAFAQQPGGIEGYGQAFVVCEEQTLDFSDMYFLYMQPPEYRDLKLWPSSNLLPTFRDSMERYSVELQRVATDLLRVMARNLGLLSPTDQKLLRIAAAQSMRMNYYPACPEEQADRVLGLSPHSDAVGLTLLLQVGSVPGLQIRRYGRRWIPMAPLPGALVANVGDVVEILTNGRYRSIEHRAVVNPRCERMSVAAFHTARFGGDDIAPLQELMVAGAEEARYRSLSVEDYVKLVVSSKLDGKNIMDAMKINPSSY